jgi:two-component system NtrC family sensor kinase
MVDESWQERLGAISRYTDSAVSVLTADGTVEWVSDSFVTLTGHSVEEAVGTCRWDLLRGPFLQTQVYQRFRDEVAAGALPVMVEAPVHRADGAFYWAALNVQRLDDDDARLVCIESDITRRRRAEESARQALVRAQRLGADLRQEKHLISSLLATAPVAVWWKDTDLAYLGCNQAFVVLRGVTSAAELVGRNEAQLQLGDPLGEVLAEVEQEVRATGKPVHGRRLTVTRPGSPLQTFILSVLPHSQSRQTIGVVGVCTDVTQMAELERQVSQTSRLEAIGQLAAGVAHEINTPVQYTSDNVRFVSDSFATLLKGLLELQEVCTGESVDPATPGQVAQRLASLDLGFLAEEVPNALTQSQEGLERVAQIVRAMKEFSHPGGERTATDINHLVDSTIQVSRSEWKYVARLEADLAPDVGEIPCYAGDLKQALLNILVNATHAVQERRELDRTDALGLIRVATRRTAQEVVIRVSDTGIGMEQNVLRRIFDPFFTTKAVGKGTGQGLSLAHSAIVTKHHGRIEVTSQPLEGTTFSIVLPIPTDADAESTPPAGPGLDSSEAHGELIG